MKESQKAYLLRILQDGKWHLNMDLENQINSRRLAARIKDLRDDGHLIEPKRGKGWRYYYRLIQIPKEELIEDKIRADAEQSELNQLSLLTKNQ